MSNSKKSPFDQRRAFLVASATGFAGLQFGIPKPLLAAKDEVAVTSLPVAS